MKKTLIILVLLFSFSVVASNPLLEKSDKIPVSRLDFALFEIEKIVEEDNSDFFKIMFNLDLNASVHITDNYKKIVVSVKLETDSSDFLVWKKRFNDKETAKFYCSAFAKNIFFSLGNYGTRGEENVYKANMTDLFMGKFFCF